MHFYSKCYEFANNKLESTKYEINMIKLNDEFIVKIRISRYNPFTYSKNIHIITEQIYAFDHKLNISNFLRNKFIEIKQEILDHIGKIDLFVPLIYIQYTCDTNAIDYHHVRVNFKNKMNNLLEQINVDIEEYPLSMWENDK